MPTFNTQIIRIAADTTSKDNILDLNTAAEPQAWWARDLTLQVGIFAGGTLLDVSGLQSITVNIKDPSNLDGSPLVTKTITMFDNTNTLATWQAGSKQHFVVNFTADDLSFTLTNGQRLVHLSIIAVTTGGQTGTICVGTINLIDDGGNSAASNPANGITVTQAQAMIAALTWNSSVVATTGGGFTQNIANTQTWLLGRVNVELGATGGAYVVNLTLAATNVLTGAFLRMPMDFPASLNPTVRIYDGSTAGTLLQTITQIDGTTARSFIGTFGFDGSHWHKETGEWVQ